MATRIHTDLAQATSDPFVVSEPEHRQRVDLYRLVHRGLRSAMAQALVRVGAADLDPKSIREICEEVRQLIILCEKHLEHENAFIHVAMQQRAPGSAAHTAGDHVDHAHALARLSQVVQQLESANARTQQATALESLYRSLALFFAHNLEHMDVEEQHNMRVLWDFYTDEELAQLEQELVAHVDPDSMIVFLRWMLPSVSRSERLEFLDKMAVGAPPGVVVGVIGAIAPHLPAGEPEELLAHFEPALRSAR